MRVSPVLGSVVGVLLAVGCASDGEAIDGEGDRYIVDGKADTGGIQEGTPEAAAVLHVASTFTRADLVGDVGLATKAADNVMAYRKGDDETAGTADDEAFETLAELDAVPFMGPIAFGKLLAFAQANDLVGDIPVAGPIDDVFNPASCQGANMSQEAAHELWRSGQGRLGTYQLQIRKRTCTGTDEASCGAWAPYSLADLSWRFDATGLIELRKWDNEVRLVVEARTCEVRVYGSNERDVVGTSCDGVGYDLFCFTYNVPDRCGTSSDPAPNLTVGGTYITFAGNLTENCLRLVSRESTSMYNGTRTEYETVLFDRF